MKKFVHLSVYILLMLSIACSTIFEMEKSINVKEFDLAKYSSKGFLFTPESYLGEYESVGFIKSTLFPTLKKISNNTIKDYYVVYAEGTNWAIENIDATEAVEEMYSKAVAMGADAIIKFNATMIYKKNGVLDVPGYEVTGFAIRRLKK